jgi:hypothetical protein
MGPRFYFPSGERCTADFIALKNPSPRPGLNPRPLGPAANTLHHRGDGTFVLIVGHAGACVIAQNDDSARQTPWTLILDDGATVIRGWISAGWEPSAPKNWIRAHWSCLHALIWTAIRQSGGLLTLTIAMLAGDVVPHFYCNQLTAWCNTCDWGAPGGFVLNHPHILLRSNETYLTKLHGSYLFTCLCNSTTNMEIFLCAQENRLWIKCNFCCLFSPSPRDVT